MGGGVGSTTTEGYNNNNDNNNNNHGFVSQDPSWEAISYLSAFVFAGLQGKKTHTHKVLWEKSHKKGKITEGGPKTEGVQHQISLCSQNRRTEVEIRTVGNRQIWL